MTPLARYTPTTMMTMHLCTMLTKLQNPVTTCKNCQTAAKKCDAFDECIVWVLDAGDGNVMSSTDLFVSERIVIRYISGESGCFKTVNGLAVGSGGSGGGGSSGSGSSAGGDGGTGGGDGETGKYSGGEGTGFDISSIAMKYYQLSAGKGGKQDTYNGGGGGGILVDGFGPEVGFVLGKVLVVVDLVYYNLNKFSIFLLKF